MPAFRLVREITESLPPVIAPVDGDDHHQWLRIYFGARFDADMQGFRPIVRICHRDWWVTPEHMTPADFEIASAVLGVSIESIVTMIEQGVRSVEGLFYTYDLPGASRPAERRSGRYIPEYIVEPLPLP